MLTSEPNTLALSTERPSPEKLYGSALAKEVGLWALIKEDFENHYGDWTLPGFQAMVVYRFGAWRLNLSNPVFRFLTKVVYWIGFRFVRNVYGIEIYDTAKIGRRLHIGHQSGIVLHAYATIGDDCIIRQGVTMGVSNSWRVGVGPVVGDRVSFGVGAAIIGDIAIGDDVAIGPNAVVSANIPSSRTVFAPQARSLPRKMEENETKNS